MRLFIINCLFLFLFVLGCNTRVTNPPDEPPPDSERIDLAPIGSDSTLEVVTWNVENFPQLNDQTISDVKEIILDLDADLYALEEIADTNSFRKLLNQLPDYDGLYSSDTYYNGSYQKTAVIYKTALITISNKKMLFTDDSYSFPRPPLQVYVRATQNQQTFDFTLIVLHLKANGEPSSVQRRRSACSKLKQYLDEQLNTAADKDFVVAGDWNDSLTDPETENVFQVFLNDPQTYIFLTLPLAQNATDNASYIGGSFRSLIDHLMITADALDEYDNGTTKVVKIDQYFSAYVHEVSDHRPVAAIFPVFTVN